MERELKKQQRKEEQRHNAEAKRAKKEAAKAEKEATRERSKKCLTGTKRSSPRSLHMYKKVQKGVEAEEDADHCCVCFDLYQEDIDTGREWIQCYSTRWLHEDCVHEEDINANGKLCPLI